MEKKVKKKSWQKHNLRQCGCHYCEGNWFARFLQKTRVRAKFFKYNKIES